MDEKILEAMRKVFRSGDIDSTTSQANCETWDSLHHLNFIVELEEAFDMEFEPEEISEMKSFAAVKSIIKNKTK